MVGLEKVFVDLVSNVSKSDSKDSPWTFPKRLSVSIKWNSYRKSNQKLDFTTVPDVAATMPLGLVNSIHFHTIFVKCLIQ